MSIPLKDLAIKFALQNNWEEAYKINSQILEADENDIEALNRMAFSLIKLGKYKKAKLAYQKVVEIDKTNPIALKNLKKLDNVTREKLKDQGQSPIISHIHDVFIEEAGKTKTTELKNLTDKKSLSLLQTGDNVTLVVKRSKIFVLSSDKKYIGMLPDNIGMRLVTFMKGGNEYQACIKALDEKTVTVFIKEVKKVAKFKNQPSFSATPFIYQTYPEE